MSNFVFACASVNGLTLAQKRETVIALRASIKAEVAARKATKIAGKEARAKLRAEKVAARAAKKAEKIAALEAKLAALKNPVGIAAKKANKKPSKVTVLKMAA
jgi:hypothetical protein